MSSRLVARIVRGPTPPCRRLYSRSSILTWTAYLGATISALSAHRPTERRSATPRARARYRYRHATTTWLSPRLTEPSRAGPDGRRSIEKFRVYELLALSREPSFAAPCSRECARECVRNLSDVAGQKCSYLVAHECSLHFSRLLNFFSIELSFKLNKRVSQEKI